MKLLSPLFPFMATIQIAAYFIHEWPGLILATILWFLFVFGLDAYIEDKFEELSKKALDKSAVEIAK